MNGMLDSRLRMIESEIRNRQSCGGRLRLTAFALAFLLVLGHQQAYGVSVPLVNSGFDDTSLGSDQFLFVGSYNGWSEVDPASGAANDLTNVGPMNLTTNDLSAEHHSANNILYYQGAPTSVRVDQTTTQAIASNQAYSLSFWVANDVGSGRFGGYNVVLYADNGTSKTTLKTLSGFDLADDALVQKSLSLVDDIDLDFTPYIGQFIGVGLSSAGGTYQNALDITVPGIVFYDSVSLDVVATVPEPSTILSVLVTCGALAIGRTRRVQK